MRVLKNELTWSFSRDRLFRECRRAYYYHYYASWGGWLKDADSFIRKAYILKNIRNIDAWIGDIVHQVIKWILENKINPKDSIFQNQKGLTCEEAIKKCKVIVRKTWEQSRSKLWESDPKNNLNLFDHYYSKELSREMLTKKLEKITISIRNFYSTGLLDVVSALPKENILTIDEIDSFDFGGVRVFAVPDFAIKDKGYVLFDWKTGKPSENDVLQLSCYVLYASQKWKIDSNQIRVIPVYLSSDEVSLKPILPKNTESIRDYIQKSIDSMRSLFSESSKSKVDISLCSKTENIWRCEYCKFQEICT